MSSVAARPDVKRSVEQVMAGALFSGLLIDDTDERAAALEALLETVADADRRVVWVGNPLRSPLTIERFLIQVFGPEIDLREERGSEALARLFAKQVEHESRLLIVVQQPETIDAQTRDLLVGMGDYLGGDAIQVQFLFAGSSAFDMPRFVNAHPPAFSSPFPITEPVKTVVVSSTPRRRDVLPLIIILVTVTVGVVVSIAPVSQDDIPPTARSLPRVSLLRREFDAFLAQRNPALLPMTEREKAALLAEIVTNRRE